MALLVKDWKQPKSSINKRLIFHLACFYSFKMGKKKKALVPKPRAGLALVIYFIPSYPELSFSPTSSFKVVEPSQVGDGLQPA